MSGSSDAERTNQAADKAATPATNGAADNPSCTLSDALKLSGIAETGGHAKALIQEGQVRVNGEVERRRKRRVRDGDEIDVSGETFVVELQEDSPLEE
ncbi:MAG: RNA-binding S4 domain-containing protein [Trueperaceae bacterium]